MADAAIDLELELDVQRIAAKFATFADSRIQDFVPILVERAVLHALRRNRQGDGTAADGGAGFSPPGEPKNRGVIRCSITPSG